MDEDSYYGFYKPIYDRMVQAEERIASLEAALRPFADEWAISVNDEAGTWECFYCAYPSPDKKKKCQSHYDDCPIQVAYALLNPAEQQAAGEGEGVSE
jgi:hypothetical protein